MASKLTTAIVLTAASTTFAIAGVLLWASRQTFAPNFTRRYDIVPIMVTQDEIVLQPNWRTTAPGTFGLHILGSDEPAVVGDVISRTEHQVKRRLIHRPRALTSQARCSWSGITATAPDRPYFEVKLDTSLGQAPAWVVNPGSSTWAIHVHGQGSDRRQTLRGVETATAIGMTSLVVSYRNDGEAPASLDSRSHLGETEWWDLEEALRFVANQGGTGCVVFGWSLGATIAVHALQRSNLSDMIKGLVMVSPVLSWEEVLRANALHQGWPRVLGSVVARVVSLKGLKWLAGLDEPVDIRQADAARFMGPFDVPALILHNRNDWSVPIEVSRRFAESHQHQIDLVEFDCIGHTQEWNSDPVMWDTAVRRWYGKLFQPDTVMEKAAGTATGLSDGVE